MSELIPDPENDHRLRGFLAATVSDGVRDQDYLECAARLLDAGWSDLAKLFYRLGAMRQGSSPLPSTPQQALERRLGLFARSETPGDASAAAPRRIDMAVGDLAALLALTPALPSRVEPPSGLLDVLRPVLATPSPDMAARTLALSEVIALVDKLYDLLFQPLTQESAEALSDTLEQVHTEVLSQVEDVADGERLATSELAAQTALQGLRAFMMSQYDTAYAPFGDSRVFHAFANVRDAGLGAYGRNLGRLIEDGQGLRALIGLARGASPALADAEEDHWCLLLLQHIQGGLLHRVLDDLSDAGLLSVMWGLLAGVVRQGARRPDRQVLERIRDAGLDFGDLDLALAAQRLDSQWWGDDKNEWLALGDIHAYRGDYAEAETAFATALQRDPGNGYAEERGRALREQRYNVFVNQGGFGTPPHRKLLRTERRGHARVPPDLAAQALTLDLGGAGDDLAPELAPRGPSEHHLHPGLHLRRLGARSRRSRWGLLPLLRGVEAIRGVYVSVSPVTWGRIALDGQLICSFQPQLSPVKLVDGARKYVFNEWVDLTLFPVGRYEAELQFEDAAGHIDTHRHQVLIEAPTGPAGLANSDALVASADEPTISLETAINGRASQVRDARRSLFTSPPRAILVLRTDQLGDLVCSVPALSKLRTLFPDARITGLVSRANEGLARTLPVFNDLILIDFPVDPIEQRRTMPMEQQEALREILRARDFDLAIDLADNSPSRLLLPLSGAPYLVGMRDDDYPFLDLSFNARSKDKLNGSETIPATNKALALIAWLEAAMGSYGETMRRTDLTPSALERFAVREKDFAVLHTGAQLKFSQWPYYAELTSLILSKTGLNVVLMTDDRRLGETLGPQLKAEPRFQLIEGHVASDELDALLSYCAVFIGNDSGPKHLASLRGSPVVSLHCARNNWNEWGQENTGLIISRRVPCAGCQISNAPDECAKAFACLTNITPQEVLSAAESLLRSDAAPTGSGV